MTAGGVDGRKLVIQWIFSAQENDYVYNRRADDVSILKWCSLGYKTTLRAHHLPDIERQHGDYREFNNSARISGVSSSGRYFEFVGKMTLSIFFVYIITLSSRNFMNETLQVNVLQVRYVTMKPCNFDKITALIDALVKKRKV